MSLSQPANNRAASKKQSQSTLQIQPITRDEAAQLASSQAERLRDQQDAIRGTFRGFGSSSQEQKASERSGSQLGCDQSEICSELDVKLCGTGHMITDTLAVMDDASGVKDMDSGLCGYSSVSAVCRQPGRLAREACARQRQVLGHAQEEGGGDSRMARAAEAARAGVSCSPDAHPERCAPVGRSSCRASRSHISGASCAASSALEPCGLLALLAASLRCQMHPSLHPL